MTDRRLFTREEIAESEAVLNVTLTPGRTVYFTTKTSHSGMRTCVSVYVADGRDIVRCLDDHIVKVTGLYESSAGGIICKQRLMVSAKQDPRLWLLEQVLAAVAGPYIARDPGQLIRRTIG